MTPLQEQLSRLWSDELPEAEAAALRQRIADEPEVGAQWDRLCAAMDALADLPDVMEPPPLRSAGVVVREARARPPLGGAASWAPWTLVAVAAAALLALWPGGDPELVLVDGAQWIEGEVELRAGEALVEVDGRAWISVEPADPLARVGAPKQEDPMQRSTVIAGVAGAIVTVVVYEGTAVVRAESGSPVVVEAGQTHRTASGAAAASPPGAPLTDAERAENIARLEQELARVQQDLEEARFEGALTRGQLRSLQGTPSEWPTDVPESLTPERFRDELAARLAGIPDLAIAEVDCDEYPCVAAVQYTGDPGNDDWHEPAGDAIRSWFEEAIGTDHSISVNNSRFRDGDKDERYLIFGAHEADRDSDVGTRTEYRIDAMVDTLGERIRQP